MSRAVARELAGEAFHGLGHLGGRGPLERKLGAELVALLFQGVEETRFCVF